MSSTFGQIQAILQESAHRSVASAFAAFLDTEINIPSGIRSRASESHNHVREFLADESTRDEHFPRILQEQDTDFLGGSFARHTKIWPLDDIDIYFPIDGADLVYRSHGQRLPYTVVTDDGFVDSPLIAGGERWMTGDSISSRKLVDGFAEVLRRHYPAETRVRRAGEAVNIQMTSLGFDIVPCFSLQPQNPFERPFYLIPDGEDHWIRTNPRIDNAVSARLQRTNDGSHRPAVKLAKWWNENKFSSSFSSYYIELATMQSLDRLNQGGVYHHSISQATAHAFAALNTAAWAGNLTSWLPGAPFVEVPALSSDERLQLLKAANAAQAAFAHEQSGDAQAALRQWAMIFGGTFRG